MPNTKLTSVKSEVKYEFQVILGLDLPSLKGWYQLAAFIYKNCTLMSSEQHADSCLWAAWQILMHLPQKHSN